MQNTGKRNNLSSEDKFNGIVLTRKYYNLEGKEISEAAQGDLVIVKLTIESSKDIKNTVIADILPAGLEIEDGALATREKINHKNENILVKFTDKREDRMLVFAKLQSNSE